MKNILVTGGLGFIGSHLVERLLKDGNKVTVVDNINTGKRSNLKQHCNNPNLKIYIADILDDIWYMYRNVDTVFHLAALTRPQWSILHPLEADSVNVQGTLKTLNHSKNAKVKRFVFASSSSLYGTPESLPTPELETPRPVSPYALQKYIGEQYCMLFQRMYGLETNCIRPFNVYGHRQNPSGGYAAAIPKFISMLSNDKPGTITGDGEQRRDFVYIDDVVELLIRASETEVSGEVFNAGVGSNVSINFIYEALSNIIGKDIEPIYGPKVFEPRVTLADMGKTEKILKYKPKVKIEDGLRMTVEKIKNANN